MLTRVTITGADDRVDPRALVALSARFPFVEWGILFSASKAGQPRYPTGDWVWMLARAVGRRPVHLSAHFCGVAARDTLGGSMNWIEALPASFERIQLNGYEELSPAFYEMTKKMAVGAEFILQARTSTGLMAAMRDQDYVSGNASASTLIDPSGGKGLDAHELWAAADPTVEWIGFAGGIAPVNVEEVVGFLKQRRDMPFFIDMESGVRTDDKFDLKLVTEVLEKCEPLVGKAGA